MGAQAPQVVSRGQAMAGPSGQLYLARGVHVAMRFWEESPGRSDEMHKADYETVGYLISGRMRLTIEGQCAEVTAGQSWLVPAGALHSIEVLEALQAIEATSPPARECDFARVHPHGSLNSPG